MRILSIDYGKKRTGLAVTDPLQIIAGGLATVATSELICLHRRLYTKGTGGAHCHRQADAAQRTTQ